MVSLIVVFYIFVILFAIIGLIRGGSQEVLVTFSVILAFFMINIMETVVLKPATGDMVQDKSTMQLWLRLLIITVLVFFGYQTPRLSRFATIVKRDRISDSFLGIFLGAFNGYLIAGTMMYYLDYSGYPTKFFINPESLVGLDIVGEPAQATLDFISKLPPEWLGAPPAIYIAVCLAFLFVLVIFI